MPESLSWWCSCGRSRARVLGVGLPHRRGQGVQGHSRQGDVLRTPQAKQHSQLSVPNNIPWIIVWPRQLWTNQIMLTSRSQRGAATPEYSILVTDRASGKGRVVMKFSFLVGAHFTNLLFVPLLHHEAPIQTTNISSWWTKWYRSYVQYW